MKARVPEADDSVVVNYRGTLIDGTEFDSSYDRGKPSTFQVKKVIKGWREALLLMKEGGKVGTVYSAGAGLWQTRPEQDHSAQQRPGLRGGVDIGQVAGSGGLRCAYPPYGYHVSCRVDEARYDNAGYCTMAGARRNPPNT